MAVSLFRGLYARVAYDLGVDASYISRVARGERRSKAAESAIDREFKNALARVTVAAVRSSKLPKKARHKTREKK